MITLQRKRVLSEPSKIKDKLNYTDLEFIWGKVGFTIKWNGIKEMLILKKGKTCFTVKTKSVEINETYHILGKEILCMLIKTMEYVDKSYNQFRKENE